MRCYKLNGISATTSIQKLFFKRLTCRSQRSFHCLCNVNSNQEFFQSVDREGSEIVVKETVQVEELVDRMVDELITLDLTDQQTISLSKFLVWILNPYIDPQMSNNDNYQIKSDWFKLLLRPIEMLNGRMAILGLSSAALIEIYEGRTIISQFQSYSLGPLLALALIVVITILRQWIWTPPEGVGIFTRDAELWSGRAAMFWFVIMVFYEIWAQTYGNGEIPGQFFYLLGQFLASEGLADCEAQPVLWGCGVLE
eukprot:TRINITY_DN1657_c0_g1_i3.p1 TRINITY_DN1657_c0_g1~~TRINITY_DN1657_c0_g1_i3.p1  ORF type:complete len:254 (+),score=23.54 TRINITY_DN1657_c0_g1_i3:130-891(+)